MKRERPIAAQRLFWQFFRPFRYTISFLVDPSQVLSGEWVTHIAVRHRQHFFQSPLGRDSYSIDGVAQPSHFLTIRAQQAVRRHPLWTAAPLVDS
ncbi:MAG: hypothetical protein QY326_07240 [Bdellovibrionota bacterium]|nr:MAG: hypothetical protein QY326_07240 [Bdellovibrionota bacterium]